MRPVMQHIREIVLELAPSPLAAGSIHEDASLPALGMDSLSMVDLTVMLEERLSAPAFPLQEWADRESRQSGPRFTVGSFARAFEATLDVDGH